MDLLEQLKAAVDFGRKLLIIPFATIPIILNQNQNLNSTFSNCNHILIIRPRKEQVFKLPVYYENFVRLLDYRNFEHNLDSPKAVVIHSDTSLCKITIT